MSFFDLLFLAVVLVSLVTLICAAAMAISGRARPALGVLKIWAVAAAAYLAVATAVKLALPVQTFHVGEIQCEDDWCFTVAAARRVAPDNYEVTLRLSSRALRVAQRNRNGFTVSVVDVSGTRYPALANEGETPFDILLQPGESVTTTRNFRIRAQASRLGLVVGKSGWNPAWLIIGREPFEKTVVLLEGDA
ncbi:MAG TPA: hypothetical protein VMG40_00330 [Bryobacteraceae bacterium]|nr:hypothetical protein [Bryobacteraceae bacterium]